MNETALIQKRKSVQDQISIDPEYIVIYRTVLVDDHEGGLCPDPFGSKDPVNIKCRISHEQSGPNMDQTKGSGLSTNLSRFINTDYLNIIQQGDQFTDSLGKSWKIGPVDPLKKFGGIVGYQAPLIEAREIEEVT